MEAAVYGTRVFNPVFSINKDKEDIVQVELENPETTLGYMVYMEQVILTLHVSKNRTEG